jgi:hypothetical protein
MFAFVDSDFDGVSDRYDECPNTPISDLVDKKGCSIKKVAIEESGDVTILLGLNYSTYHDDYGNKTNTTSESLEIDYKRGKVKTFLVISQFNSDNTPLSEYDESSFADTRLGFSYDLDQNFTDAYVSVGAGIALPNYKGTLHNNKTDLFFTVDLNYMLDDISLFSNYTYTIIGDSDVKDIEYQNCSSFAFGAGYSFMPKSYTSASLYLSEPIVKSDDSIKNLSLYHYYDIREDLFSTFSFSYGLNGNVDNSLGVQVGFRL